MTRELDALIIGAGQSGPFLAVRLAEAGQKVALVERRALGGTCVNDGCTPTKALVASARAAWLARNAAAYGVDVAGSITVDMKRVKARKDAVVAESKDGLAAWIAATKDLELVMGHARFEGPRTVRVGDRVIEGQARVRQHRRARGHPRSAGAEGRPVPHEQLDHGHRCRARASRRPRRQLRRARVCADVSPLRRARHGDRARPAPHLPGRRGRVRGGPQDPRARGDRRPRRREGAEGGASWQSRDARDGSGKHRRQPPPRGGGPRPEHR